MEQRGPRWIRIGTSLLLSTPHSTGDRTPLRPTASRPRACCPLVELTSAALSSGRDPLSPETPLLRTSFSPRDPAAPRSSARRPRALPPVIPLPRVSPPGIPPPRSSSPSPVRCRRSRARRGGERRFPGDLHRGSHAAPHWPSSPPPPAASAASSSVSVLFPCAPSSSSCSYYPSRRVASPHTAASPTIAARSESSAGSLPTLYSIEAPQIVGSWSSLGPPPTPTLCSRSPSGNPVCRFSIPVLQTGSRP